MKSLLLLSCSTAAILLLAAVASHHATAAPGKAISQPLREAMSSHGIGQAEEEPLAPHAMPVSYNAGTSP